MPASNVPSLRVPPLLVERHQRAEIGSLHGTAKRPAGERRDDLARASFLFPRARWTAGQNLAPARRILRGRRIERALDQGLADARIEQEPGNVSRGIQRPLERLIQLPSRRVICRQERDPDRMQTRLDEDARRRARPSGIARCDFLVPVEQLDALSVDYHLDLLTLDLSQHVVGVPLNPANFDHVLAVRRELVPNQHAPSRSERKPLDMGILRRVRRCFVHGLRRRRRVAEGQARNLAGGGNVRFDERRRHGQGPRHVVEAPARVVCRKELGRVDLEAEQITDRVRVLGAIQTMEPGRGQVGDGVSIELVFQPGNQRLAHGRLGPGHARRRHHAGPKLPHDLFAYLRLIAEAGQIKCVQRETRGLDRLVVAGHAVLIEDGPRRGRGPVRARALSRNDGDRHRRDRRSEHQVPVHGTPGKWGSGPQLRSGVRSRHQRVDLYAPLRRA